MSSTSGHHHFAVTETVTCQKQRETKWPRTYGVIVSAAFALSPPSSLSWPLLQRSLSMGDWMKLLHSLTISKRRTFSCCILSLRCDATTMFTHSSSAVTCKWKAELGRYPSMNSAFKRRVMLNFIHSHHASLWVSLTRPQRATFSNANQISLDLPACPLINLPPRSLVFVLWNIHLNNLLSLWLDLNSLTSSSLLDTVSLIGREHTLGRPNHGASPWCLRANGRREMVSVDLLSPGEGGNALPGQLALTG